MHSGREFSVECGAPIGPRPFESKRARARVRARGAGGLVHPDRKRPRPRRSVQFRRACLLLRFYGSEKCPKSSL